MKTARPNKLLDCWPLALVGLYTLSSFASRSLRPLPRILENDILVVLGSQHVCGSST